MDLGLLSFSLVMRLAIVFGLVLCANLPEAMGQNSSFPSTIRFQFREPKIVTYQVENSDEAAIIRKNIAAPTRWLKAWPENRSSSDYIKLGNRIVLQLKPGENLSAIIQDRPLRLARELAADLQILEASDVWTALREAQNLSQDARVAAAYPIAMRPKKFYSSYAPQPNDPYFFQPDRPKSEWQPYLENRDANGVRLGVDLNVRAAWPISRGHGVVIAFGDDGVDLSHPDLASQFEAPLNFDFFNSRTNGLPAGPMANHGTAVAGLAAAKGNNQIGIVGVAPEARLASWVLFSNQDRLEIADEALMNMFQYQSNVVSVQNHSWGKDGRTQLRPSLLEDMAISNAVTSGRSGRGVIMVRAGGNGRTLSFDANDDGYLADPRVIAVAAVRLDGRVTRYSTPGANLLVAAPSGDVDDQSTPCSTDSPNLMTTDRVGVDGFNNNSYTNDLANYGFGPSGFSGTSASTPLISGLAALILGTNPNLNYRDMQQILIHSARHFDLEDPDVKTNSAGFRVSHNLGFGVPDAGVAVSLARAWPNRPPATVVTYSSTNEALIPDQGLRLLIYGTNVPVNLQSIIALPALGPFPDVPTTAVPLVDVGTTENGIGKDVKGRGALIQRGGNYFCEKLSLAAAAGAAFAVVFNDRDATDRLIMGATEFAPVPGVFIDQSDGEALRQYLQTDPSAKGQLQLESTNYSFTVRETLLCEHVGVRIDTDHTSRADLRITLLSPKGTRSVLQSWGTDDSPGPSDWTYYSVHHFYEPSAGTWTVAFSDLDARGIGSVKSVSLIISGVPITDSDGDGLDDKWELRYFNTLAFGPQDDPDGDGYNNAREQIMGTNPAIAEGQFALDLSLWNDRLARLSWPSTTNSAYSIQVGGDAARVLTIITNVPGRFPETEWFTPYTNLLPQFFRVGVLPVTR